MRTDEHGESGGLSAVERRNVGSIERLASATLGGALVGYGIRRLDLKGVLIAITGELLIQRGWTGYCRIYAALGINTRKEEGSIASVRHGRGIKIDRHIRINSSPEKVYGFWRNFENLPLFMGHLKSVKLVGENRFHWIARAPAGMTVEWDAEVYREDPPEMISWRSLENSDVNHAGSVHFSSVSGNGGTEVRVELNYEPPLGKAIGGVASKLFLEEPDKQVEDALKRFKHLMETGEITA